MQNKYLLPLISLSLIFMLIFSCEKDSEEIIEKEVKPPSPPTAAFSYSPMSNGTIDSLFTFDANKCSDVNDETEKLSVRYDIGADGIFETNWSTNKIYKHKFKKEDLNSDAEVPVTLLVIDTDNMTDTLKQQVKFNIKPPSGEISVTPTEGNQLTKFHFQTINVANDFKTDSIKIRWNFGNDGSWSGWVWKNENKESHNFDFTIDGLSHIGEYEIIAEFQDQFENSSFDTVTVYLEKLPEYEIINVEENQVFSGNKTIVTARIISQPSYYKHQLFVIGNSKDSPISSFMNQQFDDTTHYINMEVHSSNFDDGNYTLYSRCFYITGSGGVIVHESQKIPIVIDNGGMSKLTVSSPNSSTVWIPEEIVEINWTPVSPNTEVNISLIGTDGTDYFKMFSRNVPNRGTYNYKVDKSLPTGSYYVLVNVTPETGGIGLGWSETFRISNPDPLEIVAYYGPFYELADIDFLPGSSYIYALQSSDPWIRKISGNNIVETKTFWENSGFVPSYGGFAIDGNSESSDFYVTRTAGSDYVNIMKISGTDPQNVLSGKRFSYLDGTFCFFSDIYVGNSAIYLLEVWKDNVWKINKSDLSILERYDVGNVTISRDDYLSGIAYDGNNFWISFSNKHQDGSDLPQIVKLDNSFNILKRYNMPNDKKPTGLEFNKYNGNLYMTTKDGIYKLAKE